MTRASMQGRRGEHKKDRTLEIVRNLPSEDSSSRWIGWIEPHLAGPRFLMHSFEKNAASATHPYLLKCQASSALHKLSLTDGAVMKHCTRCSARMTRFVVEIDWWKQRPVVGDDVSVMTFSLL